ncbi:urease accessory UreF family protein [Asanoa sp. WMMD1127]|uniref:urease accessory protein UreF n=1 Tax=Asanoa sp. WMMD1127 TaxID=3016107 RepID=UPI002417E01F|nr:urease accessory UreF family protein [Asanoa sp. WMMD1127]MDG4824421.1 urease accessory UreF family protein [Asanoa sp. WMMD1127]
MSLSTLLVLADGRLPAGGHAHSGGVEAAVAAGRIRDLATLESFLVGRTATAGVVAATFAAATCHALTATPARRPSQLCGDDPLRRAGERVAAPDSGTRERVAALDDGTRAPVAVLEDGMRAPVAVLEDDGRERVAAPDDGARERVAAPDDGARERVAAPDDGARERVAAPDDGARERVAALDDGLDARTASPALRAASRAQGRALLRATSRIWPAAEAPARAGTTATARTPAMAGRPAPGGTAPAAGPHHPVAIGIAAAAAGLGPQEAAVVAVYGGVTGAASAGVRLLGLDPYAVHALVARLAPTCDRIAAEAATRTDDPVDDLPAGSAILLDVDAERHATWEVRLFAS